MASENLPNGVAKKRSVFGYALKFYVLGLATAFFFEYIDRNYAPFYRKNYHFHKSSIQKAKEEIEKEKSAEVKLKTQDELNPESNNFNLEKFISNFEEK